MRPFLVTEPEAGRLPRLALIALILLYVLPGFVGRDPWRTGDAIGFGIAHAMVSGGARQWLLPEVAGSPVTDAAPLAYWFAAAIARVLDIISFGAINAAAGIRAAAGAWLVAGLLLLRSATQGLAQRAEAQPLDPFGAGAGPLHYGRAIGDAALLIALATFGLVARVHETTADAAMLTVTAAFAFGLMHSCNRARTGGLIVGASIAAAALVRSPAVAMAFALAFLIALVSVRALRLNVRTLLPFTVLSMLLLVLPWPLALMLDPTPQSHAQLMGWLALPTGTASPGAQMTWALRTLPWFFWPSWPLAARTLWYSRQRWADAPVGIPLALLTALLIGSVGLALVNGCATEATLIPLAVPLAMLAAIGLPTLARSLTRLIDWFTVAVFSLFGLGVWGWWLAGLSGWPAKPAAQALRFAAGFPGFGTVSPPLTGLPGSDLPAMFGPAFGSTFGLAVYAGGLASLGWLALVRWRISRQPPMLWRPVVLAGAGMTLAWFLLMSLWMPIFNWRNTYRDVSRELRAAFDQQILTADRSGARPTTDPVNPALPHSCIRQHGLDLAQRASLAWFADLRFTDNPTYPQRDAQGQQQPEPLAAPPCGWLLLVDRRAQVQPEPDPSWTLVWEGRRRADRNERFRLYRSGA